MLSFPMLRKEIMELIKSYKILFVPIAFAIIMSMQPIMLHMLPTLLENSGDFPEGTIIHIPDYSVGHVFDVVFSEFQSLGAIVLILIVMGAIAGERGSGVSAMALVKPVGRARYFFAKATSYSLLTIVSFYIGAVAAAYYTEVFFGVVDWGKIMLATLVFLPNLLLIISVTLFFSAILRSPVAAGALGLVLTLLFNLVPPYFGGVIQSLSPAELKENAIQLVQGGAYDLTAPLSGVLVLIILFLMAGWYLFEKQEI
jgi:ABC-2 type transport system permease protein